MSEIQIASWNMLNAAQDRTENPARYEDMLHVIEDTNADVLFVGELCHADAVADVPAEFAARMQAEFGYQTLHGTYTSDPKTRNMHAMAMLSKSPDNIEQIQLGNRFGFKTTVSQAGGLAIVGAHYDDMSEAPRLAAAQDTIASLEDNQLAVIMGDLNAFHGKGFKARVGQLSNLITSRIETGDYYDPNKKLQRLFGLAKRVGQMSLGTTMQALEAAGFVDADAEHAPTIGDGLLSFQLDHIMTRGVTVLDFRHIDGSREVSDHTAIAATLRV